MADFSCADLKERGIVPVVAAILILIILVAFFAVYYSAYVDSERTRAESEHADRIMETLCQLKEDMKESGEGESRTLTLRLTPDLPPWVPQLGGSSAIWVEGWR